MRKGFQKHLLLALIVCLFFCLTLSVLPSKFQGKGYDYDFHFQKAKGASITSTGKNVANYPPLYSLLSGFFSFRETVFYLSGLFFLGLLTPMLLVFITRNWVTALFYFCTTSYFYFFEQGVYPFALALFLCFLVLYFKNLWARLALLPVALLTHSIGFQLVGVFLIIVLLQEAGLFERLFKLLPFFPACSGYFPTDRPAGLLDPDLLPQYIVSTSGSGASRALDMGKFLKLNVEIIPLPFLIMSVKGFFVNRDWHLLVLFAGFLTAGVWHYRFFYVAALVSLIGLTSFYKRLSGWWRVGFLALVLAWGVFQFVMWFRYKFFCFPLG